MLMSLPNTLRPVCAESGSRQSPAGGPNCQSPVRVHPGSESSGSFKMLASPVVVNEKDWPQLSDVAILPYGSSDRTTNRYCAHDPSPLSVTEWETTLPATVSALPRLLVRPYQTVLLDSSLLCQVMTALVVEGATERPLIVGAVQSTVAVSTTSAGLPLPSSSSW